MLTKFTFGSFFILTLVAVAFWAIITQPVLDGEELAQVPDVDSDCLRMHVRILSEEIVPRDWNHPANLDRAADFIEGEFRSTGGSISSQRYEMDGEV